MKFRTGTCLNELRDEFC